MDERSFLSLALEARKSWGVTDVHHLAQLHVPERILGERRSSILRSDIGILWSSWFLESLLDPNRYATAGKTYPMLFSDAFRLVTERFSHLTKDEAKLFASEISRELWRRVENIRQGSDRIKLDKNSRYDLLSLAGDQPRCWICGYLFSELAIKNFANGKISELKAFEFVDVFKPIGLNVIDLTIQVDHVEAWSLGGRNLDNLKLSCAWCNRNKSNHTSIYDVSGSALVANSNSYEIHSLPQRFWTIRLISTVRRCEHPSGCSCTTENSELTIEPINPLGMATPTNLRVVCGAHHYLKEKRLMTRDMVSNIWGKNKQIT